MDDLGIPPMTYETSAAKKRPAPAGRSAGLRNRRCSGPHLVQRGDMGMVISPSLGIPYGYYCGKTILTPC